MSIFPRFFHLPRRPIFSTLSKLKDLYRLNQQVNEMQKSMGEEKLRMLKGLASQFAAPPPAMAEGRGGGFASKDDEIKHLMAYVEQMVEKEEGGLKGFQQRMQTLSSQVVESNKQGLEQQLALAKEMAEQMSVSTEGLAAERASMMTKQLQSLEDDLKKSKDPKAMDPAYRQQLARLIEDSKSPEKQAQMADLLRSFHQGKQEQQGQGQQPQQPQQPQSSLGPDHRFKALTAQQAKDKLRKKAK